MMTNVLVEGGSFAAGEGNFTVGLRLPWYRSLPLSVVKIEKVVLDGRTVEPRDTSFLLNNAQRSVEAMPDLTTEYWYVTDTLELSVPGETGSGRHDIEVVLSFSPPYIPNFRRMVRGTEALEIA